jgi:phosphate transport system permease protein
MMQEAIPAFSDTRLRNLWLRRRLLAAGTGRRANAVLRSLTSLSGLAILALLVAIALTMLLQGMPAIQKFGLGFLVSQTWDPVNGVFGALPFIYGTLVSSAIAIIIGLPVALGAAISLSELVPGRVRGTLSALVELLAAIPSVVYGLWGIFVLSPILRSVVEPALHGALGFLPLFSGAFYGIGMLAGGLILAIMIIPTIAAFSRDVLQAVPRDQREAMLALGATRWETIWLAVVPYARTGIVGSAILGLGRALGETMAITMLIGNRPAISASLFAPAYTLASVLANEFTESTSSLQVAALLEIGLVLLGITIIVNAGARFLVWRFRGEARVGSGAVLGG